MGACKPTIARACCETTMLVNAWDIASGDPVSLVGVDSQVLGIWDAHVLHSMAGNNPGQHGQAGGLTAGVGNATGADSTGRVRGHEVCWIANVSSLGANSNPSMTLSEMPYGDGAAASFRTVESAYLYNQGGAMRGVWPVLSPVFRLTVFSGGHDCTIQIAAWLRPGV